MTGHISLHFITMIPIGCKITNFLILVFLKSEECLQEIVICTVIFFTQEICMFYSHVQYKIALTVNSFSAAPNIKCINCIYCYSY